MAEITKVGFQLGSSLASKHLTDAEYIKGGYFVVAKYSDLAGYSVAKGSTDGTIVEGSLCYCQDDNKFYQYTGTTWEEKEFGTTTDASTTESGLMSDEDKKKLDGIEEGAEVNVQSDWTETNSSSDAYIKNKPTIPTVNNAKLTLKVGNQTVSGNDAFTANDATDTTYNVPSATDSSYGVVKVSSVKTSAVTVNSASTDAGKYYPVELNSDGKAIVNVPWENTVTSNVQSDWSTTNSDSASFIRNKPTALKNPNAIKVKVNNETTSFTSYDGSSEKTLTIKPSTTAGAFTIGDGATTKTIQLAGQFTNTLYTFTTGDGDGQIKVHPSDLASYNVSVKGLKSAAYQESSAFAPANHGPHIELAGNGTATTAAKSDHNHSGLYLTDAEITDKINNSLVAIMRYKGTVATTAALPTENMENGDVYNVEQSCAASGRLPAVNAGDNVVWNETLECWDVLGGTLDLSGYYTKTETDDLLDDKASTDHSHQITAGAEDDDVVILNGTSGTNGVSYKAEHAKSGVAAGTYKSVTVDQHGHITAGTNPTTLQGYGITDALSNTTHYAAGSSVAGGALKVKIDPAESTTPTEQTSYIMKSGKTGDLSLHSTKNLYLKANQTAAYLHVGSNEIDSETQENIGVQGGLTLHQIDNSKVTLVPATLTENTTRTIQLPDTDGTIITTGNIEDIPLASSTAPGLMSAAHFTTLDSLNFDNVGATETSVTLSEDLYTYTTIGKITASESSPTLIAESGKTLKDVFNTILGTASYREPSFSQNVSLTVTPSPDKTYGGGEVGSTAVSASGETVTYTIRLNNTATATYGCSCNDGVQYPAKTTIYYPVIPAADNGAHIRIALKNSSDASKLNISAESISGSNYYCKLNSSKVFSFSVTLPAATTGESRSALFEGFNVHVTLGSPQTNDSLSATTEASKQVKALLKKYSTSNDYQESSMSIAASLTSPTQVPGITTVAGSYYPYYLASTSTSLSSNTASPVTTATKFSSTTTSSSVSVTLNSNAYVWFLLPSGTESKTIQYEALGQWYTFDGGTTGPSDVALELDSGAIVTYKGYRTTKQAAAGTTSFRII